MRFNLKDSLKKLMTDKPKNADNEKAPVQKARRVKLDRPNKQEQI